MRRLIVLLVALGLIAAGCGGDSGVSVDKPWARSSPMMANAGAIYMELSSSDGDRLMGASVATSIAGTVEIHETTMVEHEMDDDAMDDDHEEDGHMPGAMMMREVGEIDLPAGTMVALAPGGYHIMLLDIASPLEVGQMIELTLTFQDAGETVVEVEVREEAP